MVNETIESVRVDKATRDPKQKESVDWRGKDFKQLIYGNLFEDSAGTDIILASAGTFYQWVSSTVGATSGVDYIVGSASSDNLTVGVSGAGVYIISVSVSFSGSNNSGIHGAAFLNGAEMGGIEFHRKLGGADIGNGCALGLLILDAGDVIDLRFKSDTNTTTITVEHVHLTIIRISAA